MDEILETENYRLMAVKNPADPWRYWLQNKDGEGMGVSERDLDEVLDEFFKREF